MRGDTGGSWRLTRGMAAVFPTWDLQTELR
jgi:hypothetical protein